MSEDDLLRTVLDMAKLFGLRTAHFRAARRMGKDGEERWETPVQGDGKGFPDLTIAGHGGVLFRELKSRSGVLSPEQVDWLHALVGPDIDGAVWRPADLKSGRIERELRALRTANQSATSARKVRDVTAT